MLCFLHGPDVSPSTWAHGASMPRSPCSSCGTSRAACAVSARRTRSTATRQGGAASRKHGSLRVAGGLCTAAAVGGGEQRWVDGFCAPQLQPGAALVQGHLCAHPRGVRVPRPRVRIRGLALLAVTLQRVRPRPASVCPCRHPSHCSLTHELLLPALFCVFEPYFYLLSFNQFVAVVCTCLLGSGVAVSLTLGTVLVLP